MLSGCAAYEPFLTGEEAPLPLGWLRYCVGEHLPGGNPTPRDDAAGQLPSYEVVWQINHEVNRITHYRADPPGIDLWVPATAGEGDCEDIALEKRRRLLLAGAPLSALRLAIARVRIAQFSAPRHHVVLIVTATNGEWVLDVTREPVRKQDLKYEWLTIQDGAAWRHIRPGKDPESGQ